MKKNAVILGVPRSGTSLAAMLFRNAGYFMGDQLLPPTDSNPRGYFEDRKINQLNNLILREIGITPKYLPLRSTARVLSLFGIQSPRLDVRAWAHMAPSYPIHKAASASSIEEMRRHVAREPFCYKDPRFTYTLSAWQEVLPENTRFLVVFRSPVDTIRSMIKNSESVYTPPLPLTPSYCELVYRRNYQYLLDAFSDDPRFLFTSYEQLMTGGNLPSIRGFFDAPLSNDQADESLSRSKREQSKIGVTIETEKVHERLLDVAGVTRRPPSPMSEETQ